MTEIGPHLQSKDPHLTGVFDRGILVVIMQVLSLVSKGSGLAKRIRLSWNAVYKVNLRLEVIESVC